MNRYPNGQNGATLAQANPNAGRYSAADCYDYENVDVLSPSDDPDLRAVTEHIHERQTEPRAQEYMTTGEARMGDSTVVLSEYRPIPEGYLDQDTYLFRPYSVWDPNSPYTAHGRPIDEITNAYGLDINPNVLVNTDSVLNGYKARVWAGHQTMSDVTWDRNRFNITDVEHTGQAILSVSQRASVSNLLQTHTHPASLSYNSKTRTLQTRVMLTEISRKKLLLLRRRPPRPWARLRFAAF